jgi:transcriptional regulator with XRE-family HTH domain
VIVARRLVGWSQSDLAYVAGVSELAIRRYEARTRVPWGATIKSIRSAFEEVGVVFLGELGVMPALKESDHRAAIVGGACENAASGVRKEFRSFRAAAHYFVLKMSSDQRDACHIVTADGKQWGRSELLRLFKYEL